MAFLYICQLVLWLASPKGSSQKAISVGAQLSDNQTLGPVDKPRPDADVS